MASFDYRLGSTLVGDQILSWGAKIEKKDVRKPNLLKFGALKNSSPVLGDEVKYYDLDNDQVFGGYIQNISEDNGVQAYEIGDYSVKLGQDRFSEVYDAGMSPEAIVEDIIDNYTELTFVSSVSTGITMDKKIVFKDSWVLDGITKMLELFAGTYNVDLSKNFNMGLSSSTISPLSLVRGVDVLQGVWKTDIQRQAEKVIVLGGIIDQRTTETVSGTGTIFNTTYTPENVEIVGFQQTTEDIDGDYTVNEQEKEIEFDGSQTDPDISYTYKSQVRVELGTGKTVILEKKYIESKVDARRLAIEYQNRFGDGSQSSKWLKTSSDIDSAVVGDLIPVVDDFNNKSGDYRINRVTLELPNKLFIDVGEEEEDLFDNQKETIERIKQLEDVDSNSDFITKYDYLVENIQVNVVTEFTKLQTVEDTGAILWASETPLATDADLISDTGVDADYALAYDDPVPVRFLTDYLNPYFEIGTEDSFELGTEDDFILVT